MVTIKDLLPFSKPMTILYIEDDTGIRENYTRMFAQVFSIVDTAGNGQEGWEKYQANAYDIVITDINMPRLNGIDMIKLITDKNPEQSIIVTSAHDESNYLLELIDLGIEKFLIKPIDFTKMTAVLFRSCKRLSEIKELHEYQSRIEEDNLRTSDLLKELQEKNLTLSKTVDRLTQNENMNIALLDTIGKEKTLTDEQLDFFSPNIHRVSALDFATHYTGDIDTLNDRISGTEETLELSIHQKLSRPTRENIDELSTAFREYAEVLESTRKFSNLAHALKHLAGILSALEDLELLAEMKSFLFGIADSLHRWRQDVLVNQTAEDIHFLDNSIISDCLQTESMLFAADESSHKEENLDDLFF